MGNKEILQEHFEKDQETIKSIASKTTNKITTKNKVTINNKLAMSLAQKERWKTIFSLSN